MPLLTTAQVTEKLALMPVWQLAGGNIERTVAFADFPTAISFVNRVADAAEKANHHPDIDIRWNKVRLALCSHDAGGLTERDFQARPVLSISLVFRNRFLVLGHNSDIPRSTLGCGSPTPFERHSLNRYRRRRG